MMWKERFQSLQWRLGVLLLILSACYASSLFLVRHWHSHQVTAALQRQVVDNHQLFDKILELRQRSLFTYSYDYTYWDEMVDFVDQRDSSWAKDNLDESVATYDASAVWVYSTDFELLYFTTTLENDSLRNLGLSAAIRKRAFSGRPFAHFFLPTASGLVEIRGATIHPSADKERMTPSHGYFFAGRLWDSSYLDELGDLISGVVTLAPPSERTAQEPGFDKSGLIFWQCQLPGWNGRPVAALSVRIQSSEFRQHLHTTNLVHAISALLTLSLLGAVVWILARWVAFPLRRISKSLGTEDTAPIRPLLVESTELGHIARLIDRFVRQKADLVMEIELRHRVEHELRLMKFSVDRAAIAVFWIDPTGRPVYVNDAACFSLGYAKDELLGMNISDIDLHFPREVRVSFWEQLRERGSLTFETELRRKDGRVIPVEVTVNYLEFDGEEYDCAFARDISERKQAERERQELEIQIQRMQRLETIGTLAGGVAHDFNNLLQPILGYADMALLSLEKTNPLRSDIEQIAQAAYRARDLIKQILIFSRQEQQERKPVQLHLIIGEALRLVRPSLPATIEIREDLDRSCGTVLCDISQIHQVLMNLCTNAFLAMRETGGVLEVQLDALEVDAEFARLHVHLNEGRYIRLTVSDTGCGMDRATMERIFEPFFTTRKSGEGSGLGLSVVHGIVMAHGGGITVYSEPGRGTTFRVYLPIAESEGDTEAVPDIAALEGSEQILLVDDEEVIANMGREMLEPLGYSVTTQTNSLAALEVFRASPHRFDIVITDQTMPQMTGDQLAREMLKIRPELPIVLITGFSERVTSKNFRRLGIRELVMKPLVSRELAGAIRRALSKDLVLD
ncbi:MAG: ATP-binding protein [bacterium]